MENIQPKFLSNIPLAKDLFEGKSQEKTADTICDILKRKDFQVIGIDGGWGTGKSNLVSIIENKLKNQNFHFFIYDVWGHQEDEQRRAILEELTEFIAHEDGNVVVDKKKWKENLKDLLAKSRTTRIITQPVLSIGIVLSVLAIVLTPLFNSISIYITKDWLKTIVVSIPFLGLAIAFGVFFIKEKNAKKALMKLFEIYEKEKYDTTTFEKVSEDEPSVKKFRNWMKNIDEDLNNSKLVLVFDNFDRLPKEDILNLWSSIHVFFAEVNYKNIKVIIPFDRQHIKNAFKDLDRSSEDEVGTYVKENYSEDYINKTFDIIYRVSPPILSNWKNYFKEKWIEAFGKIENDEYERVVQLYEIFNDSITPRDVIAFINEIVSLKLLFNGKIPEQYFALFILNKDTLLKNSLNEISEPTYLSGASYIYKNDEGLQKYMTAIVYQIDPDNAIDLVYTKQLKNAMVNRDIETFRTISGSPFFANTIYQVINEIENIEFPIETLNTLDSNHKHSQHIIDLVWRKLHDKAIAYSFEEFELRLFQKILLKNVELETAKSWLKRVLNGVYFNNKFNAEKFSEFVDDLNSYLTENKIQINVFEYLNKKTVKVELFIPFISNKLNDFNKYKILCSEVELNRFLSSLEIDKLEDAKYIKFLKDHYSLDAFSTELQNKIEKNRTDKTNLSILYNKLKEISDKPVITLLGDAEIHNLFNQAKENEEFYYDLIAMRLSRLNDYNPTYASIFATILKSEDDAMAAKIAERIEFYINYDDYLLGATHFTNSPLFKAVAVNIISNDYGISTGVLRTLLLNFEKICQNTEVEPQLFLSDLDGWDYENPNMNDPTVLPNLLYTTCITSTSDLAKLLVTKAFEYFENLTKDEWVNIFDDLNSKLFQLLEIVSFNKWNSYSTAALLESLEKMVAGGELLMKNKWAYVFNSCENAGVSLTNVFKGIRDKFYNDRSLIKKDLFSFFINYFQIGNVLEDRPGDSFRTFFMTEYLDDEELINLMISKSEFIYHLMNKSQEHDVSDFIQGIRDRYEHSELIKKLAQLLKIEVSQDRNT